MITGSEDSRSEHSQLCNIAYDGIVPPLNLQPPCWFIEHCAISSGNNQHPGLVEAIIARMKDLDRGIIGRASTFTA
ncbi:hypothetical protein KHC28_00830 [Ancylobacter sonchi]|uniref:hypothetical protein n=1 Tax=Ancylobacter sonchi TaxID=1937790 RepID=UPI001BD3434A|nr:hypothetical protein [Ancylobacter sonchi]MBS7532208.1 hypothetical protein [Ancylobacter sonchi]